MPFNKKHMLVKTVISLKKTILRTKYGKICIYNYSHCCLCISMFKYICTIVSSCV